MKIVDVAEFYSPMGGGVRTYIHQKLLAAAELGHDMVVVAPGPSDGEDRLPGGRIIWVKSPHERFDKRYHRFTNAQAVHAVLDQEAPDVVEASSTWAGARAVASWQGHGVKSLVVHQDPVAVYAHTFLDGFVSRPGIDRLFGQFWSYLRTLSSSFDTTVVSGGWMRDRLTGFGVANATAVPFGVDRSGFGPQQASHAVWTEMRTRCGLSHPEARVLVTVSRHHPEKRLGTLIDAVSRVAEDRPVGLFVIGDGPIRWWVERKAKSANNVCLAGFESDRSRIAQYLASADAMLHGGAAETFGIVLAEGLLSGLPLIVPDAGGAADLADGAYAEMYRAGDTRACAAAIHRMLGRDLTSAKAAALMVADQLSTPVRHFERLFDHYGRLTGLAIQDQAA